MDDSRMRPEQCLHGVGVGFFQASSVPSAPGEDLSGLSRPGIRDVFFARDRTRLKKESEPKDETRRARIVLHAAASSNAELSFRSEAKPRPATPGGRPPGETLTGGDARYISLISS